MRWPKYWSFSFCVSPSSEHPGLISFRMDWLDLLAVQGTLKSLLHSSKASILRHLVFFTVQLSHPHMTTGKTIALTRRTFVGKEMSLLFNMLSRLSVTIILRILQMRSSRANLVPSVAQTGSSETRTEFFPPAASHGKTLLVSIKRTYGLCSSGVCPIFFLPLWSEV